MAEEALGSLLSMPLPRTEKGFRSALVMAALIGRQIEADFANPRAPEIEGWQTKAPAEAGQWLMRCGESDFKATPMIIEDRAGELWALDELIGAYPLDKYHAGLTRIAWKKPASDSLHS